MRGYPPVHLLILMLAFGALAVPLINLTTSDAATQPAPEKAAQAAGLHKTLLRIRLAHPPQSISLKHGDKELLPQPDLKTPIIETQSELEIPADGIELLLSAAWPASTPDTALTLEIEPDELDTKTETLWSTGSRMTEVISFQWK